MLNYKGFPTCSAVSINHEALHTIPSDGREIQQGDSVTIQTAIKGEHAYANMGWSFAAGELSDERLKFLNDWSIRRIKAIFPEIKRHTVT